MGLYGERVGAVSFVCGSAAEASALLSNVKGKVVRPAYSSPPLHGARLAAEVLGDPSLYAQWQQELAAMAGRVKRMRGELKRELQALDTPSLGAARWAHLTSQIGMFAYTGLTGPMVDRMRSRWSVYLTRDGRISVAGLMPGDVG
jgi:aspartate/tyrosine/aromatic aminotransferase